MTILSVSMISLVIMTAAMAAKVRRIELRLQYLEDSHTPSPLLTQMKEEGKMGFKSGEGFMKWTPEEVEKQNADLNEYLIRMLYGK